jgi:hypothetical protein
MTPRQRLKKILIHFVGFRPDAEPAQDRLGEWADKIPEGESGG